MIIRSDKVRLLAAVALTSVLALSVGGPSAWAGRESRVTDAQRLAVGASLSDGTLATHPEVHRSTAGPPEYLLMGSGSTSNGHKLQLKVEATKTSPTSRVGLVIDILNHFASTATGSAGGQNSFNFNKLKSRDFVVTGAQGTARKATLKVGSAQLGPFGTLSLSFMPSESYTAAKCSNAKQGYYDRTYSGTVKGTIDLKTKNANEPSSLGEIKRTVALPHSRLELNNGCASALHTGKYVCQSGFNWSSPDENTKSGGYTGYENATGGELASNGSTFKYMQVFRRVGLADLGTGVSGFRTDTVMSDSITQTVSVGGGSHHKLTVKVGPASPSNKLLSGSATEVAKSSGTFSDGKCYSTNASPKATKTQTERDGNAPFVYMPGSCKLTAKSPIGKNITMAAVRDTKGTSDAGVTAYAFS